MKLIITVTFLLSLVIGHSVFSQDKENEEVIQSVRDRYYRINGGDVDLETFTVDKYKVSAENGKVAIIKEEVEDGRFEYYFDADKNVPYFIFFASKNDKVKPDLRAYLDSRGEFVWYKENEQEIELENYRGPYHLILGAVNAYNTIMYHREFNDPKADSILDYVEKVHDMVLVKNTVDYQSDPNEGNYSEWDIAYHKFRGRTVLTQKGQGGEHGSSQEIAYFREGEKILTIVESSSWIGFQDNVSVTLEYFDGDAVYRKEIYRSYGENVSKSKDKKEFDLSWFDRGRMVPEITVY
ncbi:hypothetical protein JKA74_19895 [Marivirga sp. S37H4]|uniref:Uncharacterized protein n=1 Tax=Marivirga aurantiaca TaxID=2802615 RepID=A0A934X2S5_9BACT|nr:hypothetical protein [Marivirga aurantiaca]MBK6267315.1 hypothetical protein [Marivirga aurantiaca]